ncbi:hypothetical protein L1987_30935 [Smallanthus sonchifolius]|uniref:Uncharacterized protein n=1 Tax=Smallanthus sonchifolius TaxID=185202 RepID=A0ACB9I403_9ASTR|nr:hypothetical protein L1987_30935 [Smallanthus sonchifolius]
MGMANYFKLTDDSKIGSMELELKAAAVGLQILTTKTRINHSNPIFQRNQIPPSLPCFLKSCFLCHKHLSLNKDVYMYRGDQGFCSEECRSRQIYIDDIAQLEISTRRQSLNAGGRCDNHQNRHRRKSMVSPIFS